MSFFMEIFNYLALFVSLAIVIGSIILLVKSKSKIIILMIIGQGGSFLIKIGYRIVNKMQMEFLSHADASRFFSILSFFGFFFTTLFAVGLIIYAFKALPVKPPKIPQI